MTDLPPQKREWTLRVLPSAEIERGISVGAYPSLMVVIDGEEIDGEVVVVPKSQNQRMLREVQEERDEFRCRAVQAESRAKAAEARVAELERELGRLRLQIPRLEHDLIEARHPGYQAWLSSSECARLTARLHQATEALRWIANRCKGYDPQTVEYEIEKQVLAALATLAGEDDDSPR